MSSNVWPTTSGRPPNRRCQSEYEITATGREELKKWFASPVGRGDCPRDEVAIKLALAITTPGVDVAKVVTVLGAFPLVAALVLGTMVFLVSRREFVESGILAVGLGLT